MSSKFNDHGLRNTLLVILCPSHSPTHSDYLQRASVTSRLRYQQPVHASLYFHEGDKDRD